MTRPATRAARLVEVSGAEALRLLNGVRLLLPETATGSQRGHPLSAAPAPKDPNARPGSRP